MLLLVIVKLEANVIAGIISAKLSAKIF